MNYVTIKMMKLVMGMPRRRHELCNSKAVAAPGEKGARIAERIAEDLSAKSVLKNPMHVQQKKLGKSDVS